MKRRVTLATLGLSLLLLAGIAGVYKIVRDPFVFWAAPDLPHPPLKELATARGINLGSFASLKYLRERAYRDIITSQFEYAIIDGEPNWQFENHTLRPSRDGFDFADLDKVFAFAKKRHMPVRVQHLVWGDEKWLPSWLTQGGFTREELLSIIKDHITVLGARYKGRVREYSVVNEAFSRELETGGNKDWWGKHLGREYIDESFIWAREADPNAILILNDFGNETEGEISNLMYDYIKGARSRGVPIDALGMQMHISAINPPPKDKVIANMKRFAALGIKVYITEFDVNMHDYAGDAEAKNALQSQIYQDMLGACLAVGPDICPNFGFLGLIDRQSWYNGLGIHDAAPLMFTDNYAPKPAFYAVRQVLGSD